MAEKVQHKSNEFLIGLGGKYAYVKYHISDGTLYIDSTFVPEEHRGRGLAETLAKAVIEHARQNNLKIVPICSYAKLYFERHPEYRSL
jgi:hypothetical protein